MPAAPIPASATRTSAKSSFASDAKITASDPRLLGDRRYDPDASRDGYDRAGFGSGR